PCSPAVGRRNTGCTEELAVPLGGRLGRPAGAVPGFGQGLVDASGAAEVRADGHAGGQRGTRHAVHDAAVVPVDARRAGPADPVPRLNEGGGAGDTVLTDRGAGGRRDARHAAEKVLVGPVPDVGAGHGGPLGAVPEFGKGLVVALPIEPV